MEGEYSQEWTELRRLRTRMLILVLALIATVMFMPVVNLAADQLSPLFGFGWVAIWAILVLRLLFTVGEHTYWSCPRCGKSFHRLFGSFWNWDNPFARRCLNCGLPKWMESDPDPTLKRDLNPFRTDS